MQTRQPKVLITIRGHSKLQHIVSLIVNSFFFLLFMVILGAFNVPRIIIFRSVRLITPYVPHSINRLCHEHYFFAFFVRSARISVPCLLRSAFSCFAASFLFFSSNFFKCSFLSFAPNASNSSARLKNSVSSAFLS